MNRRTFIEFAAGGAAALTVPGTTNASEAMQAALARPRLLDLLHDKQTMCELGRMYLAAVPAESNAPALANAILAEPLPGTPTALRAQVNDRVQRDFDEGRIVTVGGWILSVTEARQCALYSLQA